jgi:hypothetical protein
VKHENKEDGDISDFVRAGLEKARVIQDHEKMALLLFRTDPTHRLQNFIQRTPGARARFYRFFGKNPDYEDFLYFGAFLGIIYIIF